MIKVIVRVWDLLKCSGFFNRPLHLNAFFSLSIFVPFLKIISFLQICLRITTNMGTLCLIQCENQQFLCLPQWVHALILFCHDFQVGNDCVTKTDCRYLMVSPLLVDTICFKLDLFFFQLMKIHFCITWPKFIASIIFDGIKLL